MSTESVYENVKHPKGQLYRPSESFLLIVSGRLSQQVIASSLLLSHPGGKTPITREGGQIKSQGLTDVPFLSKSLRHCTACLVV